MDFEWDTLNMKDFSEIQQFGLTHGKTKAGSTRLLTLEEYKQYLKLDTVRGFIRNHEGMLIGMLILVYFPVLHQGKTRQVSSVIAYCIHTDYRNRGLGKKLIRYISLINRDRTEKLKLKPCHGGYYLHDSDTPVKKWTIALDFKKRLKVNTPRSYRLTDSNCDSAYRFVADKPGLKFPTRLSGFKNWISTYDSFALEINNRVVGVWSQSQTNLLYDNKLPQQMVVINYQVVDEEYSRDVLIEMIIHACQTDGDRVMGFLTGGMTDQQALMEGLGITVPDDSPGLNYHGLKKINIKQFNAPFF